MFGGPRCFHRRFLLPFDETPRVRQAYNRNRFVLETMLGQAHAGLAPTHEAGLREVVSRLADPLARDGIDWYLGGSAAAWVLGSGVPPRDLDLGTSRAGVDRIAELLREYLIEPIAPTDWPPNRIVRGARAFVGSLQEGIRVEWAVPIDALEPPPLDEWSGRPGVARLEKVRVGDAEIAVSRPEYALVRAATGDDSARTDRLAAFVRARGADAELLTTLLARSPVPEPRRLALLRAVGLE